MNIADVQPVGMVQVHNGLGLPKDCAFETIRDLSQGAETKLVGNGVKKSDPLHKEKIHA